VSSTDTPNGLTRIEASLQRRRCVGIKYRGRNKPCVRVLYRLDPPTWSVRRPRSISASIASCCGIPAAERTLRQPTRSLRHDRVDLDGDAPRAEASRT
jgi:hypothetical protein